MRLSHLASAIIPSAWLAIGVSISASANVITDWDEKAVAVVMPAGAAGVSQTVYAAERTMGMVHAAMFDAVNSIERRYQPYVVQLPADRATSKDAAAAAAAATILAAIDAKSASAMKDALASYLASIRDDDAAKADGVKLGLAVAAKILDARANDGHDAVDEYRPRTSPGVYVPTAITAGSNWSKVKPFAMTSASQFRPDAPVALSSKEWATDYNEIKDYGGRTSAKRSPQQTENARFWLMVGPPAYHPFVRQLVIAKKMSISESARFMALASVGLNDALIAVFDAKYHYNFWRPITAIRNGDIDGNDLTEREASWQPIENTPMHPEYPCAHCILSGTIAGIVKAALGTEDIPEIAITSPAAPGVTHRYTNMTAFADEVANARICAGFHYRFSTRVGTDMGLKIGEYVVGNVMQPAQTAGR
ncbi:vanadium-dependent haloperoxidase [Bradyrhizobium sp. HKCCYLS1011]|uniref:vanadium-dependent haloperoxidase n=1 Tax=Bradyrhizobium sp. HKCCYLS1011 TaxID=3420733 RepID=UPI003EBCED4E